MDIFVIACARAGVLYAIFAFLILPLEARLSHKDLAPVKCAGQFLMSVVYIIVSGRVLGWW